MSLSAQGKSTQKDKTPASVKKSSKNGSAGRQRTRSTLKRSTLGFEVEFFILDKNGQLVNEADLLLKKIEEKKRNPHSEIIAECSKNMIEVGSYPSTETTSTVEALVDNLKLLLYTADEQDLLICPLATYPGKGPVKIRSNVAKYRAEEILFGQKRYKMAGSCVGFHFHHALPWGVFDQKRLTLKKLINSKNKQSLVNAYNFLIAADPAITTFMQSSPFFRGRQLAKDCRLLIWRGGQALNYPDSLYANLPKYGALPGYEHTETDIINSINSRYEEWLKILQDGGVKESELPKYHSVLDTNWTPIRINAHGTIEQRGMDMNHLLPLSSVAIILSRVLRAIQEDYYKVFSSDVAVREPFKVDRKIIYIPPDTHVLQKLQYAAAYRGMDDDEVWYYCKRLVSLVKILEGKKNLDWLLEPLERMIKDRKTVSDEIIAQAKKLGYENFKKPMPNEIAAQIAVEHSKRLFKEIVLVQKMIDENK